MFNVNDFFKLLKYYKDGTLTGIDPNIIISAEDSKAKTTTLFNDNLDLACHVTDDYKRLKEFLIRWYSTLTTFVGTGRHASDISSLPEEHLNILINSFGYTEELGEITWKNKIDFFYDLVNLYKIKGTPESIERALAYFGIPDVDLIEYWLQYDEVGTLILRPELIKKPTGSSYGAGNDLDFDMIIDKDPHWMLSKAQINQLFLNNRIAFPSKTPYFSLRPTMQMGGNVVTPTIAILSRMVQDQYTSFNSGHPPDKIINSSIYSKQLSLLDLYLGCVYTFNDIYSDKVIDSTDLSFLCYNDLMTLTPAEIITLYGEITKRANSKTRDDLAANRELFYDYFTRLRTSSFLTTINSASEVLVLSNLEFKEYIDYSIDKVTLLIGLLKDLSTWIRFNISLTSPYLANLTAGFDSLTYIKNVVNFFKPYHARLILVEHNYVVNNPIFDAVIVEDRNRLEININQTSVDFDTADGADGYLDYDDGDVGFLISNPITDSCKQISNLYVDSSGEIKCTYDNGINTGVARAVLSNPPIGCYRINNLYLKTESGQSTMYIDYNPLPESAMGTGTQIISNPPASYYIILNIYYSSTLEFKIVYDPDYNTKKYYSRNTYDCDSYFDIGASTDFPPKEVDTFIEQYTNDYYNTHISDSTSLIHIEMNSDSPIERNIHTDAQSDYVYWLDSTANDVIKVVTDGGWSEFDSGALFDSPMTSDVCIIKVYDNLSQVIQTEDDGTKTDTETPDYSTPGFDDSYTRLEYGPTYSLFGNNIAKTEDDGTFDVGVIDDSFSNIGVPSAFSIE